MKIAVFSDIHSSYSKMATVFKDMEKHRIDKFICLGDIIGYGDKPEDTIKLLMEKMCSLSEAIMSWPCSAKNILSSFPNTLSSLLLII